MMDYASILKENGYVIRCKWKNTPEGIYIPEPVMPFVIYFMESNA